MVANNENILARSGELGTLNGDKYCKVTYDKKATECLSYETKTLCQLFEDQVVKSSYRVAIEYQDTVLSFAELNAQANQLARYIRSQFRENTGEDLKPDTIIPISIGRSANFIIGILGILKAGAAYAPVNPDYPEMRIEHILTDINSELVLTDQTSSALFKNTYSQLGQIVVDEQPYAHESRENLYLAQSPTDLAYIIYTSGSSGLPKGVMAQHANVISQVICTNYFHADQTDTMAFFSDVSFDSTTFEIWGALLNGAKLFIPDNFLELISSPFLFKEAIEQKNLTILLITRALFDLLYTLDETVFASLKFLLVGGEALTKHIMHHLLNSPWKPKHLINAYGPTENSTFCTTYELKDDFNSLNSVPIGRPYSNRVGFVVDKHMQLVPAGMIGELYVGGPSLSRGYLNNPDLTVVRFIANPFFRQSGELYPRIYKTSDLVKWLPDGNLEYVGRNDFQVKLRGYRIELPEIETRLLEYPGIKHSVVLLHKNDSLSCLIGYYVADNKLDENLIRDHLAATLPEYMIPGILMHLDSLPITSNGKLDRQALPAPESQTLQSSPSPTRFESVEEAVSSIWSKTLNIQHFGHDVSFFNLGGNSLAAMMVRKELEDIFSIKLNIVDLFQYTTLLQLSEKIRKTLQESGQQYHEAQQEKIVRPQQATAIHNEAIAIVGMSCRLPEAKDINAFWQLLLEEKSNIRELSCDELFKKGIGNSLMTSDNFVRRGAQFEDPFQFDAGFFGYSVKDAQLLDPQQRQFLECAWEALEHSGNVPEKFTGDIGVFATQGRSDYFINHIVGSENLDSTMFQAVLANEKDFLSTRLSYKLNLKGPAITVQTACSSSLVAIQLACESLKTYSSDMALAGGVSLFYNNGYEYHEDMIESADGYCRAFDAQADGTVITSGVGVLVLKRFGDAIAQNDTIYAVIKGGAINNDGADKMAFTAPGVNGQSAVIEKALQNAHVSAHEIDFIEAHGTGTHLGDPIEWTALHKVYEKYTKKKAGCTIGSVKTNIGHTDSAAGAFGVIKTALALKNKIIPATLNFESLNPEIASFNKLFKVTNKTTHWERHHALRRAAVSSFGLGGTNAHIIMEEYAPENIDCHEEHQDEGCFLIPFSAKNRESLYSMANKLNVHFQTAKATDLKHIAYTMQEGRAEYRERGFFIVNAHMGGLICSSILYDGDVEEKAQVIWFISDFFADSMNPYQVLYDKYPAFKLAFDNCAAIVQKNHQLDINSHKQLLSFSIQFALSALLIAAHRQPWGVCPTGAGVWLAGILTGSLTLEKALLDIFRGGAVEAVKVFASNHNSIHVFSTNNEWRKQDSASTFIYVNIGQSPDSSQTGEHIASICPEPGQDADEIWLRLAGRLWSSGQNIQWSHIHNKPDDVRKIALPTYSFVKKHYEIEKKRPVVKTSQPAAATSIMLPLSDQLKGLWVEVLGVSNEELNDHSHFLELGGDSLSFISLLKHIKTKFEVDMSLQEIIQKNEFGEMLDLIIKKKVP